MKIKSHLLIKLLSRAYTSSLLRLREQTNIMKQKDIFTRNTCFEQVWFKDYLIPETNYSLKRAFEHLKLLNLNLNLLNITVKLLNIKSSCWMLALSTVCEESSVQCEKLSTKYKEPFDKWKNYLLGIKIHLLNIKNHLLYKKSYFKYIKDICLMRKSHLLNFATNEQLQTLELKDLFYRK